MANVKFVNSATTEMQMEHVSKMANKTRINAVPKEGLMDSAKNAPKDSTLITTDVREIHWSDVLSSSVPIVEPVEKDFSWLTTSVSE
jgi:hypothetical protein